MTQKNDLASVQSELLHMMKDIHCICQDNGIEYSLTGGSLLGAVRENGFIPWDDDMDIMVDRKNYERLRLALQKSDQYEIGRGPWLQHIRPIEYASDIDPYIDVFILDNLPDGRFAAAGKILMLRILQGMLKEQVEYEGFSAVYKACIFLTHFLGKPFTRRFKLRMYDRVSQIGNGAKTGFVSITNDAFALLKIRHDAALIEGFEDHPFEDTVLRITRRFNDYLANRYGRDYMTPPAEKDRIQGQHRYRHKVRDERIGV